MKLAITKEWFDRMVALEGDHEIGAGFSLVAPPPGCTPAYGSCHCSCHRSPGMLHVVACCRPEKLEAFEVLT